MAHFTQRPLVPFHFPNLAPGLNYMSIPGLHQTTPLSLPHELLVLSSLLMK